MGEEKIFVDAEGSDETIEEENEVEKKEGEMKEMIEILKRKKDEYEEERKEKRENLDVEEYVDYLISDFPSELRAEVTKDLNKMIEAGLKGNQLKAVLDVTARRVENGYRSKLTGLSNKEFVRADIVNDIDNILKKENVEVEDFKKIGYVFLDLNGLKGINDIAGHKQGDKFLKLAAKALNDEEIEEFAKENGLELKVAHESGDEFSIKVKGEKALTEDLLNGLIKKVQGVLYNMEEAKEIIDLKDEKTLYEFYKIEATTNGDEIFLIDSKKFKDFKETIPEDYEFRAFFSAGASTLYEGVMEMDGDIKNRITEEDSYEKGLGKSMGGMLDGAELRMFANKKEDKENARKSEEEHEKTLARVWDAGREGGREMKEELILKRKENEELKQKIEIIEKEKEALVEAREVKKCLHCGKDI